eukprot:CAMPEP_0182537822 /NCGR_PEP_ID=MMETSP1323-20130603/22646_1 /TAXON_ID=236787 /ORGANISM="Florenciella parvula, Strain RCC1693" /LENGTH=305 /DNA_ID=CAMNT_0024748245 /DNA_START=78 /DNA_END=995 /DNA_ORIENTATION=+
MAPTLSYTAAVLLTCLLSGDSASALVVGHDQHHARSIAHSYSNDYVKYDEMADYGGSWTESTWSSAKNAATSLDVHEEHPALHVTRKTIPLANRMRPDAYGAYDTHDVDMAADYPRRSKAEPRVPHMAVPRSFTGMSTEEYASYLADYSDFVRPYVGRKGMYESNQYDIVADYEPPVPVISKTTAKVYPTSIGAQIRSCFTSKSEDDLQEIADFVADYCHDEECVVNAYLEDECVMDYLEGLDDDEVVLDRQYSFDVFQTKYLNHAYEKEIPEFGTTVTGSKVADRRVAEVEAAFLEQVEKNLGL